MQFELISGMVNITFCSSGEYFSAPLFLLKSQEALLDQLGLF